MFDSTVDEEFKEDYDGLNDTSTQKQPRALNYGISAKEYYSRLIKRCAN